MNKDRLMIAEIIHQFSIDKLCFDIFKTIFKNLIVLNGTQIQIVFVTIEDRDGCCERHQQQTVMRN